MARQPEGGGLVILGTFLIGIFLSQLPLSEVVGWARPEWVALILIYWVIALPQSVGVGSALAAGVVLDVLRGSVLGSNALALVMVAYLANVLHRRMRMFPVWQQSLFLIPLIGSHQLILHWVQTWVGFTGDSMVFLLPALVSGLFWPFVFLSLRRIRRVFRVG